MVGSDQIIRTFEPVTAMAGVLAELSASEVAASRREAGSFAGFMVFPVFRGSVNQVRGTHPRIQDRFDLTLECIRRFYLGDRQTPLGAAIDGGADFFALFGDFRGYVEFFLLDDLVDDDGEVRFFSPWRSFEESPLLPDVASYREYRRRTEAFIRGRNRRMLASVRELLA